MATHYKLVKSVKKVVKPAARPNEAPRRAVKVNYFLTIQQADGEVKVVQELGSPLNPVEEAIGYLIRGDTMTDHNLVDWLVNPDYSVVKTFTYKVPPLAVGPRPPRVVTISGPAITEFTVDCLALEGIDCWRHPNLRMRRASGARYASR